MLNRILKKGARFIQVQSALKIAVMLNMTLIEVAYPLLQVQSALKIAVMLNILVGNDRKRVEVQSALKIAVMLNSPFVNQ